MKKTFLLRMISLTFFCLAYIAIKSETSACKMNCPYAVKNKVCSEIKNSDSNAENGYYRYDAFFIKI